MFKLHFVNLSMSEHGDDEDAVDVAFTALYKLERLLHYVV